MTAPRVILASQSPRRRELLTLIGIRHEVKPAAVDETHHAGEDPVAYVERVARDKVSKISATEADAIVIGADTTVVIDGDVLAKPDDEADAARMLGRLSGRSHFVHTAIAVARGGRVVSAVETVTVGFRALTADEIAAYIATREPMDKAGAYGIQGYGATIVQRVEGDYFSVMGLGLHRLIHLLDSIDVRYDFAQGLRI
jgi:septum formation protein